MTRRAIVALILALMLVPLGCAAVDASQPRRDSSELILTAPAGSHALLLVAPAPDSSTLGKPFGAYLFAPAGSSWLYPAAPYTASVISAARGRDGRYALLDSAGIRIVP